MIEFIKKLLNLGYSEAYVEAVAYGKYKYKYSIGYISNCIIEMNNNEYTR